MSFRLSFPAFLVLVLAFAGTAAHAAPAELPRVGVVDKVENQAETVSARGAIAAVTGAPVHLNDVLRTGPEGRLQVTFADGSALTLGEKASVTIDRYVYDPAAKVGETVLIATKGAFRFATGRIKALKPNAIQVATPIAVIGIRGTEFWGGPIDDTYGVLLLDGEVVVTNRAGSVTLAASGQGTDIASADEAPSPVQSWSDAKIARALASVALH
jgi:hypothetical protein